MKIKSSVFTVAGLLSAGIICTTGAVAQDTIKVGVLHSLSGTMAISETTLKDTVLMMIDAQNKKGGVLKVEASGGGRRSGVRSGPLFAEKGGAALGERQSLRHLSDAGPRFPESPSCPFSKKTTAYCFTRFSTRAKSHPGTSSIPGKPHRTSPGPFPAVDYLMKEVGAKRWVLEGTDYVYPRTTNKILEAYLLAKGVKPEDISINYTPFGYSDWQARVAAIKKFGSAGKKTAVVSTINGDANVPFYKELGNQKISAEDIPVVAFSVGEEELPGLDAKPLVRPTGGLEIRFESINTPANKAFITEWHTFIKNPKRTTNDPMEATLHWFQSVGEGSDQGWIDGCGGCLLAALPGTETPNLTGGIARVLPNHHITKPVFIGEVKADGQFNV